MASLKFEKVVTFSSESKAFPASNLISSNSYKKWHTQKAGEGKAFVVLKLEKSAVITGIDIGNEGSAFVEVQASQDGKDFTSLLPTSSFMSPMESKADEDRTRVRMFTKFESKAASTPWMYLKIMCSQPFSKQKPFGITFMKVRGNPASDKQTSKEKDAQEAKAQSSTADDENIEDVASDEEASTSQGASKPNRGFEVESESEEESSRKKPKADAKRKTTNSAAGPSSRKGKSPQKRPSSTPKSPPRPHRILDGVLFALSGFQNPLRAQIRSQALSMGARYAPDWSPQCTHLVCAFPNTPKWSQVAKHGGRVVTKDWIAECEAKGALVPWRDFKCGTYRDKVLDVLDNPDDEGDEEEDAGDGDDSDYSPTKESQQDTERDDDEQDEVQESEAEDSVQDSGESESDDDERKAPKRKRNGARGTDGAKQSKRPKPTEESRDSPEPNGGGGGRDDLMDDEDDEDLDVPEWNGGDLGTFFCNKRFHLKDDIDAEEMATLKRYIAAHCGELCITPSKADYVVSWAKGSVSPQWVARCHQANRLLSSDDKDEQ